MLVFQNADLDAEFHGDARFAFADPFRVRLKEGEDFLGMRDDFPQYDAAPRLVDLAARVVHEAFDFPLHQDIEGLGKAPFLEQDKRLVGLTQSALGDVQIVFVGLDDERGVFLLLFFRAGFAAFLVLGRAHEPFEVPDMVGVLPPVADAMMIAPLRGERDDFAHGVVQQVDIGGKMYIRFNHKGSLRPRSASPSFFFSKTCPVVTTS